MLLGILAGILTCSLWGLSFVLPLFLGDFNEAEITLGRYFCYGIFSVFTLLFSKNIKLKDISLNIWLIAFFFAFIGNLLYYFLEVYAIHLIGPDIVTIVFSLMPLMVAILGNAVEKEFSFKLLTLPISIVLAGLLILQLEFILEPEIQPHAGNYLYGFLICFISISTWSIYAILNSRFLRSHPNMSGANFSSIVGIACLVLTAVFGVGLELYDTTILPKLSYDMPKDLALRYFGFCALLGIFVSWLGTYLWNYTCQILSVSISGLLVVCETIFGLIYVYTYIQQWPSIYEAVGALLVLAGVIVAIRIKPASH